MSNFPAEAARLITSNEESQLSMIFKGTISRDWTGSCSVDGKTLADTVHEMRDARILRFLMVSSYLIQLINLAGKVFQKPADLHLVAASACISACDWMPAVHYYYTVCSQSHEN
jgi:hypothetical protein